MDQPSRTGELRPVICIIERAQLHGPPRPRRVYESTVSNIDGNVRITPGPSILKNNRSPGSSSLTPDRASRPKLFRSGTRRFDAQLVMHIPHEPAAIEAGRICAAISIGAPQQCGSVVGDLASQGGSGNTLRRCYASCEERPAKKTEQKDARNRTTRHGIDPSGRRRGPSSVNPSCPDVAITLRDFLSQAMPHSRTLLHHSPAAALK